MCAPSLDPPQLRRRQSFVIRKSRCRGCLCCGHSTPFSGRRECLSGGEIRPPYSSWANSSEIPVWIHNTNATAEVSPCNGISTIFGQHNACLDRDDNGRGLLPPSPFRLCSQYAHTPYRLTRHTVHMMYRSHILATMSSYSGCALRLSPNGHLHHSRWT